MDVPRSIPRLLILILLLYFWANAVDGLDRFPAIHEDESWIAAPGYTFWTKGYFGDDLAAGFYGVEQHNYTFMPLFGLLVGGSLRLLGVGLFQARIVSVLMILLTLALTYRLGARLFSAWHGLLAAAILLFGRVAAPLRHLVSGIPLADVARIARYDSAVPAFGLAAAIVLVGILKGEPHHSATVSDSPDAFPAHEPHGKRKSRVSGINRQFFIMGVLVGLATLSHLYGAFWLVALLLAAGWCWGGRCMVLPSVIAIGAWALVMIPWLAFVAPHWDDFVNQYRIYASRFAVTNPQFYLTNLAQEVERYQPVIDGSAWLIGTRIGLLVGSIGLFWLIGRAIVKWDISARVLLTCGVVIAGLFALLLSLKTFSYLATLWVVFALVVAAGALRLWQIRRVHWGRIYPMRWLLVLAFTLVVFEGLRAEAWVRSLSQTTTPLHTFAAEIAAQLPPNSRALALHRYWLGLVGYTQNYRSLYVPMLLANPYYVSKPIPFAQAADAIPADIVLFDQRMFDFFKSATRPTDEYYPLAQQILRYVSGDNAILIGTLDDPSYGHLEIYRLRKRTP